MAQMAPDQKLDVVKKLAHEIEVKLLRGGKNRPKKILGADGYRNG